MSAAKESNNKVLLRLRPRQDEARRANKVKNKVMKNVAENKAHQIREPTRRQSVCLCVCVVCVSGVVCVIIIFTARHSHKGHNHIFHQSQQQR